MSTLSSFRRILRFVPDALTVVAPLSNLRVLLPRFVRRIPPEPAMTFAVTRRFAVLAAAAMLPAGRLTSQAPATPRTGAEVLEAMRAAYAGKWYHTLTFKQKTTFHRPDGVQEEIW